MSDFLEALVAALSGGANSAYAAYGEQQAKKERDAEAARTQANLDRQFGLQRDERDFAKFKFGYEQTPGGARVNAQEYAKYGAPTFNVPGSVSPGARTAPMSAPGTAYGLSPSPSLPSPLSLDPSVRTAAPSMPGTSYGLLPMTNRRWNATLPDRSATQRLRGDSPAGVTTSTTQGLPANTPPPLNDLAAKLYGSLGGGETMGQAHRPPVTLPSAPSAQLRGALGGGEELGTVNDVATKPKTPEEAMRDALQTRMSEDQNMPQEMRDYLGMVLSGIKPPTTPNATKGDIVADPKSPTGYSRTYVVRGQEISRMPADKPMPVGADRDLIDPETRNAIATAMKVPYDQISSTWSGLPSAQRVAFEAFQKKNRGTVPQGAGMGGARSSEVPVGVTGDAALEGQDAQSARTAKLLAEYKIALPTGMALRTPEWQHYLDLAAAYNPSFDQNQYKTRQGIRTSFTSGKDFQNIKSLNTAMAHLASLQKYAAQLDNGKNQWVNAVSNYGKEKTGNPAVTGFGTVALALENELATVFKGTSGTDQEIKAWREQLHRNMSPQQFQQFVDSTLELLAGRAESIANGYTAGMGEPRDFSILNERGRAALKALGVDVTRIDPQDPLLTPPASSSSVPSGSRPAGASTAPKVGETRMFGSVMGVWDGKNWVAKDGQ